MDIQLTDITLYIKESLDLPHRAEVEGSLRALSVYHPDNKAHLFVVEYNPRSGQQHRYPQGCHQSGIACRADRCVRGLGMTKEPLDADAATLNRWLDERFALKMEEWHTKNPPCSPSG